MLLRGPFGAAEAAVCVDRCTASSKGLSNEWAFRNSCLCGVAGIDVRGTEVQRAEDLQVG